MADPAFNFDQEAPAPEQGLTAKDYQTAIFIQNACNLSGVVYAFSRVMSKIWVEARRKGGVETNTATGKGTDWVNTHPIAVLYADKIADLSGSRQSGRFVNAYGVAEDKGKE